MSILVNQAKVVVILSVDQNVHTDIYSNQGSNKEHQGACIIAGIAVIMTGSAQI
jgi:hypothetical protein